MLTAARPSSVAALNGPTGMSSGDPYAEQYVAYSTVKSPATCGNAVLTKVDIIEIK